jgi:hypothetical protein
MKIYRVFPMIWYSSREQAHRTVYGIEPEPERSSQEWLNTNVRCARPDCKDPLYIDDCCYTQILLNGNPVTWRCLPEWLTTIMANGYSLYGDGAEMPKPNKSFYIVLN